MTGPLRVFVSHTAELAVYPKGRTFVQSAVEGIGDAHAAVVEQDHFAAASRSPVDHVAALIEGSDIVLVLAGFRYGTPVPGHSEVSYVEHERATAIGRGRPVLAFLLDEAATGLPRTALVDPRHAARQDRFRAELRAAHTSKPFSTPDDLRRLVALGILDASGAVQPVPPAASGGHTIVQLVSGSGNISFGKVDGDVTVRRQG